MSNVTATDDIVTDTSVPKPPARELTNYEAGQQSLIFFPPNAGWPKEYEGNTYRVSDL